MTHPDPLTAEKYRQIHNIGDPATLARIVAEHQPEEADADTEEPTTDPDYVPNPPYDLPSGVTNWSEWCR